MISKIFPAILLIGPTGAGKTPLGMAAEKSGLPGQSCHHFDFGAQLRAIQNNADRNALPHDSKEIIREVLQTGRLLEEHENFVALDMVKNWAAQLPDGAVIILNGLPRTIPQAEMIRELLDVKMVVQLEAPDHMIQERIAKNSGGDRTTRNDDNPEQVTERLKSYRKKTMPLLAYYRKQRTTILPFAIDTQTASHEIWNTVMTQWDQA